MTSARRRQARAHKQKVRKTNSDRKKVGLSRLMRARRNGDK